MKNQKEKNEKPNEVKSNKHDFRLVWKNDHPQPDGVPCILIGELLPPSGKTITLINTEARVNDSLPKKRED